MARQDIDSMVFRLNFYDVKNGLPNQSLLSENIIISNKDVTGRKLSVDLSQYNIIVEDDFYVTLECVDYYGENELEFCASVLRGPRVTERMTSQGNWNKLKIASIAFNVTVKY